MSSSEGSDLPTSINLDSGRPGIRDINIKTARRILSNIFPKKSKPLNLDATDAVAVLFFTAIGMLTRVFRIQFPNCVVFDEFHFGSFTNYYIKGEYFFDIHPPLAKLIMAGVAKYAGYDGSFNFGEIGDNRYPSMIYVSLRMTPAFFGGLCVPLSYIIMRTIGCSHFTSFVGAALVTSDLMLIVEARHILSDGILHFFSCLAIFSIYLFDRYPNLFCLIFEGICLGCVASCKYTSGGIVLLSLLHQFRVKEFRTIQFYSSIFRCIVLVLLVGIIHLICYTIHLSVLPYLPNSDLDIPSYVRTGLVNRTNPNWEQRHSASPLFIRIISLILQMHRTNMNVGNTHPYASKWYTWPLFTSKWVLYWTQNGKHIMCMGNVLLWYPVFIGIVLNLLRCALRKDFDSITFSLLMGYLFSYLPFSLIKRDMFLYHYAIPLLFGIYNLCNIIEKELPPKIRGFMLCAVMTAALFGYFLWNPWVYGLTTPDFNFLVWNNKWRG